MDDILIRLNPDQILYYENDPSSSLYIIKKGVISMITKPLYGPPIELTRLSSGQIIGDLGFFDPQPRSSTALAVTECEIISLPYTLVQRDFEQLKPWFKSMLNILSTQVKSYSQEVKHLQALKSHIDHTPDMEILRYLSSLSYTQSQYGRPYQKFERSIDVKKLKMITTQVFLLSLDKLEIILKLLSQTPFFEVLPPHYFIIKNPEKLKNFTKFITEFISYKASEMLNPSAEEITLLQVILTMAEKKEVLTISNILNYAHKKLPSITIDHITTLIQKKIGCSYQSEIVVVDKKITNEVYVFWNLLIQIKSNPLFSESISK